MTKPAFQLIGVKSSADIAKVLKSGFRTIGRRKCSANSFELYSRLKSLFLQSASYIHFIMRPGSVQWVAKNYNQLCLRKHFFHTPRHRTMKQIHRTGLQKEFTPIDNKLRQIVFLTFMILKIKEMKFFLNRKIYTGLNL